jgi:hypothetical protein
MRQILATSEKRLLIAMLLWTGLAAVPRSIHADGTDGASTAAGKLPPFSAVRATVERTLAANAGYRPGDLLSQRQVTAVIGELKKSGWEVQQGRKLLARAPAEGEFIVRAMRTPQGAAFMRKIAAMPGGYDRVDRLSRIPGGQQTVQKLIEGPDGHKLVGYLAEARGGKEMGAMLGKTAQGADFNEPTGRIYTAKQLLDELEGLHEAAVKQAAK